MTEQEELPPPYMMFLVVFLFFITGLLGFLICHLLKKKGYRCRTGGLDDEEEEEENIGVKAEDEEEEEHQDTVEQILKCILENEANMEAFNEMLGNHNICPRHDPRLRKDSIGGVPPHHHTVHSGTDHNTCHLCAQIKSKKGRRQSRTPRFKQRPGEQTVFSVGRFRVTHTDKKLHGGPQPFVSSGDQLDQSQESDERKEGGYNLRSMFKDARPTESTNGVAPSVGKRRKSVTIFGLRRGSDPVGIKGGEWTGRETGKKQPVLIEEPIPGANNETFPGRGTKSGSEQEAKDANSAQSNKQASSSAPKNGPGPEPRTNLHTKPSGGTTVSTPRSILLPSPSWSGQTPNAAEKETMFNGEDVYDPGPLQTSTPLGPMPGATVGSPPGIPVDKRDPHFPVIQTPPDLSASQDLDPGFGGSLALISLGSSPLSSLALKSSSSSLKTPTSPSSYPGTYNRADASSPALTPSPKLLSGRAASGEFPAPSSTYGGNDQTSSPKLSAGPRLDAKLLSLRTPSTSPADRCQSFSSSTNLNLSPGSLTQVTKEGRVSSLLSLQEQQFEARTTKTETKRTPKSQKPPSDRWRSLPLSPSSPDSPSTSGGNRVSSVMIIKASPDSRREFSVVTMVEDAELPPSLNFGPEEAAFSSAAGQRGIVSTLDATQPESQREETSGAEGLMADQDKCEMMEMEDIRDCKVTQEEVDEKVEEELEKTKHGPPKQD